MDQNTPNPFIEPENYFQGYQKSIDELKNNPEILTLDKLCYEAFEMSPMGKEFLTYAKDRFILNSQITRGSTTYQIDVIWQEGFRDAYRMIMQRIQSHKQRINAGK